MADDRVTIEVNGVPIPARRGQMIMQATDAAGVYVPRFCYHDKLTVAANCRMCLVEVEKAPKPMPACATPVADGMKVFTKSPRAIGAQRATMEFLLINHPLDCPICDQGGECELQDLAMGFGRDVSRFAERKRVVADKNIGPLVSTDMTRCIHCTRCVRFTSEIAGLQELGATGRGEDMQIGTWIEKSVDHELSGNIIDLCPVGALNSKPFRYQGRAWEMVQAELVSPHDPVGSNLYGHVRGGRLMRVVPRPNEAINETWIADRDRFSYEGLYSSDRLTAPMVRVDGELKAVDWDTALGAAADGLRAALARGASQVGVLGAPTATSEELYLLAKLARSLGISNVDYRLRQLDFRDQDADPRYPSLGLAVADVESLTGALIVGSHLRREAPILAHRLRKAALGGARVAFLNPEAFPVNMPVAAQISAGPDAMTAELIQVGRAIAETTGSAVPASFLRAPAAVSTEQRAAAAALLSGERRWLLLGALASRHPAYAAIRAVAGTVAALAGASLGYLVDGGNAAGAALAGCLPHRGPAGQPVAAKGSDARAMLEPGLGAYLLYGGVDPAADCASGNAAAAVSGAGFVLALTAYLDEAVRSAHVLLPIAAFAESSGTYVNAEGRWQSVAGCARPPGNARPGWKVLRVLAERLGLAGFSYDSSEQARDELKALVDSAGPCDTRYEGRFSGEGAAPGLWVDVPMYQIDAVVRRAPALQATAAGGETATVYGGAR
jgi:NADH-quinone oxidoreductase subunit G